jgi:antirestriction protein ArdC
MAANAGYRTPRYLTFRQALDLGGNVRKGEHGTKVCFVKQLQVRDEKAEDNSATRLIPMMREYTVFNVEQCENLPDSIRAGKPMRVRNPDERHLLADDFVRATGADVREGHGEAYYASGHDFISMPAFNAFKGADHFYNVAFHELTHWTGHKSRLDRDLKNRFGSRAYAAEESRNLAPHSSVPSSHWMATFATPATSKPGLNCSRATSALSSRRAARRRTLPSTCAAWHLPMPRPSQRKSHRPQHRGNCHV